MKLHTNVDLEDPGDGVRIVWTPRQEIPGLQFTQPLLKHIAQLAFWGNRSAVGLFNQSQQECACILVVCSYSQEWMCVPTEEPIWHPWWWFKVFQASDIKNVCAFLRTCTCFYVSALMLTLLPLFSHHLHADTHKPMFYYTILKTNKNNA